MNFVVTTAHRSNYPDPIELSPGDRVTLGRRDARRPRLHSRDSICRSHALAFARPSIGDIIGGRLDSVTLIHFAGVWLLKTAYVLAPLQLRAQSVTLPSQ